MNGKRVFITGGSGFIGRYVVEKFLSEGWGVSILSRNPLTHKEEFGNRVSVYYGDLRFANSLKKSLDDFESEKGSPPDAIVHCAGRVTDIGRKKHFESTIFNPTKIICDYVALHQNTKLVYVSTTDVYGLKDFFSAKESELDFGYSPKNPYPKFKIESERWITSHLPECQYSIVRPASVWGLGDKTLAPRVLEFLRSSPWIIHFGRWKGKNRWPLAHVRNVAAGIYLAATSKQAEGQAFHVLDSEYTTINEYYKMLLEIYYPARKPKPISLPFWLGKLFGSSITLVSNALNLDQPFADPSHYAVFSISKNLDFNNHFFLDLMSGNSEKVWLKKEGIEELVRFVKSKAAVSLSLPSGRRDS